MLASKDLGSALLDAREAAGQSRSWSTDLSPLPQSDQCFFCGHFRVRFSTIYDEFGILPSLKLTASLHLKMDGWNTILSFWDCLFSGAMLVLGRVSNKFGIRKK